MEPARQLVMMLRQAEVLCSIPEDALMVLAMAARVVRFRAGKLIATEKLGADGVWIVLRGRVRLKLLSADGAELLLRDLLPGALFRVGPAGPNLEETAAEVLEDKTMLALIAEQSFMNVVRQHPVAVSELLAIERRHNQWLCHLVAELAFCCVEVRLAHKLVELTESEAGEAICFSHADLARMIGSTRQQVSVHLERFRDLGFITYHRRGPRATEITVRDIGALALHGRSGR